MMKSAWMPRLATAMVLVLASTLLLRGVLRQPVVLIILDRSMPSLEHHGVEDGLRMQFAHEAPARLIWRRLDTNAALSDPRAAEDAARGVKEVLGDWNPDAVVLVHAGVQELLGPLLLDWVGASAKRRLVYAGSHSESSQLARSTNPRVCGMRLLTPWSALGGLVIDLAPVSRAGHRDPRPVNVAMVYGPGEIAEQEAAAYRLQRWASIKPLEPCQAKDLKAWAACIDHAASTADVLLVGDYHALAGIDGAHPLSVEHQAARQVLMGFQGPVVALWAYAIEDGLPLAAMGSPIEQGTRAASMALEKPQPSASRAAHGATSEYVLFTNETALKAHAMTLPAVYKAFARISRDGQAKAGR